MWLVRSIIGPSMSNILLVFSFFCFPTQTWRHDVCLQNWVAVGGPGLHFFFFFAFKRGGGKKEGRKQESDGCVYASSRTKDKTVKGRKKQSKKPSRHDVHFRLS